MRLSLRARLTLWYSALVCLALVLFTALVLWAEWQVLLHQADETLTVLAATATNAMVEEMGEHQEVAPAAVVAQEVVKVPGHVVMVFDRSGHSLNTSSRSIIAGSDGTLLVTEGIHTVRPAHGPPWRVAVRRAQAGIRPISSRWPQHSTDP